ncbi:hypothetical protein [Robertmurraya sp.]|uniref:hypothetical protein n=1 Tax=Robertmurraya sp. TaxID=2837525 RepID=UPI003703766A
MRKFEGLSDFFRNATDEEKREVYLEVMQKANEEQLKIIEKAKELKEIEQSTTRKESQSADERFAEM